MILGEKFVEELRKRNRAASAFPADFFHDVRHVDTVGELTSVLKQYGFDVEGHTASAAETAGRVSWIIRHRTYSIEHHHAAAASLVVVLLGLSMAVTAGTVGTLVAVIGGLFFIRNWRLHQMETRKR